MLEEDDGDGDGSRRRGGSGMGNGARRGWRWRKMGMVVTGVVPVGESDTPKSRSSHKTSPNLLPSLLLLSQPITLCTSKATPMSSPKSSSKSIPPHPRQLPNVLFNGDRR